MKYKRNKKGFTLIELLAVMAILAVLVLIAMPNLIGLFNTSRKSMFMTEAKILYDTAMKQNLFNSGEENLYNTGDLQITGGADLEYSILTNTAGQVVCFQVANDDWMWIYRNKGFALSNEEDIAREEELAPRDYDIILDCTGASLFDATVPATLGPNGSWWEGTTEKSQIERIVITYSYRSTDYDETFYSDEEKVGGLTTFVKDNVAYLVINRNKRKTKSVKMPANSANTFSGFVNLKNISGLKLLDFTNVKNMDYFFGKASDGEIIGPTGLSYINGYETLNLSGVTSAKYAFAGIKLSSIDLSNWNVHNLQDATGMFYKTNASMINLAGWDVANISNYNDMFAGSTKLESINLAGWNTNPNAQFNGMFNDCSNLISITADSGFRVNNNSITMFANDRKIVGSRGTTYSTDKSLYARIDLDGSPGYLSNSTTDGIVSAKLYETGTVSGSFTELTNEGSTPPDWDFYSGPRLLEVKLFSMTKNARKTLEITVPTGMYIVDDSWTKSGKGITNVTFTKLANQGTGAYSNNRTGTLKYTFGEDTTSSSVQLLVMFDTAIWDKNKRGKSSGTENMTLTSPITVNYNNGSVVRKIANIHSAYSIGKDSSGVGYSFYSYNYNSNVFVDNPTILLESNFLLSRDQSSVPYFHKEITYETYATFKNTSNETVYADVEAGALPSHLSGIDTTGSTTKLYKGKWTNVYTSGVTSFPRPKYTVKSSDNPKPGSNLTVTINATIETYSGQKMTLTKTLTFLIKSTDLDIDNDLYLGYYNFTSPDESYYDGSGYAGMLGIFYMYNKGYQDINNVKVIYEYDTTTAANSAPGIKVMAARPFLQNGQQVSAKVTLVNSAGARFEVPSYTIKSTSTADGAYLTANSVATSANLTGTYYLKKIEYTIPTISGVDRSTGKINYLYHNQGASSQTSGGNFMGVLSRQGTSTCSIYYNNNLIRTVTSNSYITNTPSFSGNISSIRTPLGTDFTAGDNMEFDINVAAVSYPYTNTQAFRMPEVYLVLPFGINIDSVVIGNSYTETVTESEPIITKIKTISIGDVLNNVYKISPTERLWFGYLNLKDSGPSAGQYSSKWFNVKLSTDISMEYTSFNLRDSVYFKDANGHIYISGAYGQYSILDQYDVDDDEKTNDKYGTTNNPNQVINIYANEDEG